MINDNKTLMIDFATCLRVPMRDDGRRLLISPQRRAGKWKYMAPEIVSEQSFDGFAVDIWSVGVILFRMVSGCLPWDIAADVDRRFLYTSNGFLVQLCTKWNLNLSPSLMDLLQKMFFRDPRNRLSLRQICVHEWVVR